LVHSWQWAISEYRSGPFLNIEIGLSAHRSHLVRDFILARRERLAVERLPSYAPELNPVEYLWGYWKHHELPNYCPREGLPASLLILSSGSIVI